MKILLAWNIIVFIIYGFDKLQSIRKKRRVGERTLMIMALLMGGVGVLMGMTIFHHKTRKTKFWITAMVGSILTVSVYWYFLK